MQGRPAGLCGREEVEKNVIQGSGIEHVLAQNRTRLEVRLQQVFDDSSGPEKGSDAWLLLNALTGDEYVDSQEWQARFEQSGRSLALHGGKLDARVTAVQHYAEALVRELKEIVATDQLAEAIQLLYQVAAACVLALTRGYQSVFAEVNQERKETSQRLEHRFQTLQRINAVTNSTMDLDQTLEITAQAIAEELHTDLCSIFFYDELQRVLTLHATNGPRPLGGMHFTLRIGEGYSGWVADKGRPLLVQNVTSDGNFSFEANTYTEEYHGLMALPIIFFGNTERLIGVISIQSKEPRDFSRDEMSFVEVVAGIVAINIENGRLYEQTDEQLRRKVYELATIHRVSSIIASTLNLDEVLQIISTQAVHLSGAERSCIFELDPERQQLHVVAHYGLDHTMAKRMHLAVGQCCAGRCVQSGRPQMDVDCQHTDEHCILRRDPFVSAETHSVLCVPLQVKQKILGCICIYSSHRHLLNQEQMQLVVTFANEAAIAIDNARLFEEARRGLELKSVLLRELHHRVKNNLATVAGILSLQRRRTRSPEVRYILAESVNRVQGLAATHDLLAHEDVSEARVDDIARKIVGVANANLTPPDKHITFEVQPCAVVIPSRAVSVLALVLNEMVSNAIKHGMADQRQGRIAISGREEDGIVIVEVIDTGSGPPQDVSAVEPSESGNFEGEGLGLSLIKNMIGDLDGSFTLQRRMIAFPIVGSEAKEKLARSEHLVECTVAEVRFPLVRRRNA